MLKKLNLLIPIAISTLFIGCHQPLKKDNTLRAVELTPKAEAHQMIADLEVSEKKVMGQAQGKALSKEALEKEAVAEALKQTDGDVLVGVSYFYEFSKNANLSVTVVGYPARYKNFRPKEVDNNKTNILLKGQFVYEDGSNNNLSVTVDNAVAPAAPASPATHSAPAAHTKPAAHEAVNTPEE